MKRCLAAFLALVLLLTGLAAVASAETIWRGGFWEKIAWDDTVQKYYYKNPDGSMLKFTGWKECKGTEEYVEEETGEVLDTWNYDYWIYGDADGYLTYGWKEIGGAWYYFWPEMCTGSYYDSEKKTAYLLSDSGAYTGASATKSGWFRIGQDWYYVFEQPSGWYDEDDVYHEDGTYLYFASTGIYEINDNFYAFKNGKMLTAGWQQPYLGVSWAASDYYKNFWVYVGANGALATGWKKMGGTWYYFDTWNGKMCNTMFWDWNAEGTKLRAVYAFDTSGAMLMNKWYEDKWEWMDSDGRIQQGSSWYYLGADGAAKQGWFEVGGKWYYSGEYFNLYTDAWIEDSAGNWYYLTDSGEMAVGWYKYYDEWLYFRNSGEKVQNDWVKDGNSWYYMDGEGCMVSNTTLTINGVEYRFGADGAWIP